MILTLWKYLQSILILSLNFERFSEKYIIEQYISSMFQEFEINVLSKNKRHFLLSIFCKKLSHQTAARHERLPHLRIFILVNNCFQNCWALIDVSLDVLSSGRRKTFQEFQSWRRTIIGISSPLKTAKWLWVRAILKVHCGENGSPVDIWLADRTHWKIQTYFALISDQTPPRNTYALAEGEDW